jgi:hypothetical protein
MTTRFPDLEAYIRAPDLELLQSRLTIELGVEAWQTLGQQISGHFSAGGHRAEIVIQDRAYKNYCSVWIKHNVTPWPTDLDFGKWLAGQLPSEVRCSQSGWIENEPLDQPTLWYRLRGTDIDQVRWD